MEEHPTPEILRRFFSGANSREENAWVARHLVASCKACRESLSTLTESRWLLSRLLELPEHSRRYPPPEISYDWAFARVNRTVSRLIEQAHRKGKDPIGELLLLPRHRLLASARKHFSTREAVETLLTKSHQIRYEDPRLMLMYAELARIGAEALTLDFAESSGVLMDLRACVLGHLANALRVNGRFSEADRQFVEAERIWEEGSSSLQTKVKLLEAKAALRCEQRQYKEAVALTREAASISRDSGDAHSAARAQVAEAISCLYSGDPEGSILLLNKAIPMIDSVRDAHLLLAAHHNLAASYIEIGRPEEALAIADSIRDLYRAHAEPGVRLKALWQQGALLLEVGHLESAEKLLSGAREGYLELGLAHEAAEISLRLAEVYRRNGETQKLRRTLEETVPIFRSLRFGPELLAAMIRLQEAAAAAEEGTTA